MTDLELLTHASAARTLAYAPYSGYSVGAALLCTNGEVYTGCNIENASYTPTVCAERTAVFKAVSQGNQSFTAIAIVGGPAGAPDGYAPPCGVCRQVLNEFCDPSLRVILIDKGEPRATTLGQLLPEGFGPRSLKGD